MLRTNRNIGYLLISLGLVLAGVLATASTPAALILAWILFLGIIVRSAMLTQQTHPFPWWLHPAALLTLAGIAAVLAPLTASPSDYLNSWRTPKFVENKDLLLLLTYSLVAAGAAWISSSSRFWGRKHGTQAPAEKIRRLGTGSRTLAAVAFLAYCIWYGLGVFNGLTFGLLTDALLGHGAAVFKIKEEILTTIPGITTATQFAPAALTGLVLAKRMGDPRRITSWLILLLSLTALRAMIAGERLALVEAVLPLLIVILVTSDFTLRSVRNRTVIAVLPLILPIFVVIVFGAFEYSRSWSAAYRYTWDGSYTDFILSRLQGYYATATNNSAVLLSNDLRSTPIPYSSLEFFWKFPGIKNALSYESLTGIDPDGSWMLTLQQTANPEFSNRGGWLQIAYDYGRWGGLVVWAIIGLFWGWIYRNARAFSIPSLLLLSVGLTGFLDLPFVLHWMAPRTLPTLIGIGFLAVWSRNLPNGRRPK